jgi:hypothetical protein
VDGEVQVRDSKRHGMRTGTPSAPDAGSRVYSITYSNGRLVVVAMIIRVRASSTKHTTRDSRTPACKVYDTGWDAESRGSQLEHAL